MNKKSSENMASNAIKGSKNLDTIFEIKIGKMVKAIEKEVKEQIIARHHLPRDQNRFHTDFDQIQMHTFYLILHRLNNQYNKGVKILWN